MIVEVDTIEVGIVNAESELNSLVCGAKARTEARVSEKAGRRPRNDMSRRWMWRKGGESSMCKINRVWAARS